MTEPNSVDQLYTRLVAAVSRAPGFVGVSIQSRVPCILAVRFATVLEANACAAERELYTPPPYVSMASGDDRVVILTWPRVEPVLANSAVPATLIAASAQPVSPSTSPAPAARVTSIAVVESPWWQRLSKTLMTVLVAVCVFLLFKVAPALLGYVAGRAGVSALMSSMKKSDPQFRAVIAGFRDAGLDAESTLKALGPTADSAWFYQESSKRSNTHLNGAALHEMIRIRSGMMAGLSIPACAAWTNGGPPSAELIRTLIALPDSVRARITYLSSLAVARALRDPTPVAPVPPEPATLFLIFRRYATTEELATVEQWSTARAPKPDLLSCTLGNTMYRVTLRAPFPSSDADALMGNLIAQ